MDKFLFNLDELKTAKKNVTEKRSGNAEIAFNEGQKILESFRLNPSVTSLEKAGSRFIEALEYNSEHAPSLVYLSYVLFALGNEPMALKYIKMAERFMPSIPPDIYKFKEKIEKSLIIN
jgi:hypothetical protein